MTCFKDLDESEEERGNARGRNAKRQQYQASLNLSLLSDQTLESVLKHCQSQVLLLYFPSVNRYLSTMAKNMLEKQNHITLSDHFPHGDIQPRIQMYLENIHSVELER